MRWKVLERQIRKKHKDIQRTSEKKVAPQQRTKSLSTIKGRIQAEA